MDNESTLSATTPVVRPTMTSTPQHAPDLGSTLSSHRIWGQLDAAARDLLCTAFTVQQAEAQTELLAPGAFATRLGMVLQGTVHLGEPGQPAAVRLQAGDVFGLGVGDCHTTASWHAQAASICTLAWLEATALRALCAQSAAAAYHFVLPPTEAAAPVTDSSTQMLSMPVRSLLRHEPVTASPATSIREVAQTMSRHRISSMLLVEDGRLYGLVTDRDLRNRVVAQGLDWGRPVAEIATRETITVHANSPAFEALLLMARHAIHHVPVMDGDRILGMVTTTDVSEQHSSSAVHMAGEIARQTQLEGLQAISQRVGRLQQSLAAADATAYSTGHIVTAMTDAITVRLIELALAELGPAPVDYVWVAAGSQARNEQTAKSDQDNCLILDDRYDEATHGAYFKAFARRVCDGLAACGYIHCPGEMMAMTDTWRQPRRVWADYFRKWIDQPKPKALMLTCVFFDLRAIAGNTDLLEALRQDVLRQTKGNSLFLAHMAGNALKHRPPVGLFGQISPLKGGDHPNTIDLKHTGIVPIVDLARIYALAAGVSTANTHDRLEVSAQAHEISAASARDLREALEYIGKLRIDHQARQTARKMAPDNFLPLDDLSNFERGHLKAAFAVVQTLQDVLQKRYG